MSYANLKAPPETAVFLDTSIPNIARVFDYLTGGTANFEADRKAAEVIQKVVPSLGKWIKLRRAFAQTAAKQLYQAGFRQFLDLGSGMPASDHIHAFAPEANIIFSDINPVAVSYGQSIFDEYPTIDFVRADYRQIDRLFYEPEVRNLIDLSEPVAIGVNHILLFMTENDICHLAQSLYGWAPAGSKFYLTLQTRSDNRSEKTYEEFRQNCRSAGLAIELYTYDHTLALMAPWQPDEVWPLVNFLELPPDFINETDKTELNLSFSAGFLKKL